ncbi:MAG: hypothetical protein AB1630_08280 [bacterium]
MTRDKVLTKELKKRWMIIHTFGLCADINPRVSVKAIEKAKEFLEADSGACLWDRTIIYLGYIGSLSKEYARQIFPVLEKALIKVPGQTKTILESFERMTVVEDDEINRKILEYALEYMNYSKSSVRSKASKIQRFLTENKR